VSAESPAASASLPAAAAPEGHFVAIPVSQDGAGAGTATAAASDGSAMAAATAAAAVGLALDNFLGAPDDKEEQEAGAAKRKKKYDVEFVKQWMAKKKLQEHREKEREKAAEEERERQRQAVLQELKSLTVEQGRKYRQRLADKQGSDDKAAGPPPPPPPPGGIGVRSAAAVRRPRGVHPWELTPSASTHVQKEIAAPLERVRMMHEYGNQVRKQRGILAQAAARSRHGNGVARPGRCSQRPPSTPSRGRRPRSSSLSAAGDTDTDKEEDEQQADAPEPRPEHDHLATHELAPTQDVDDEEQDAHEEDEQERDAQEPEAGEGKAPDASQGRGGGGRRMRVALLAPKIAWASQQTRRAELQELLGGAVPSGKHRKEVRSADILRGDAVSRKRKEAGESADEESAPVTTTGAQKTQRLHALRDAAEQLSALVSSLSRQRREAREQTEISEPVRLVSHQDLADLHHPLRLSSRAEAQQQAPEVESWPVTQHEAAREREAGPVTSSVAIELVEEEIDSESSDGDATGDGGGVAALRTISGLKSMDDSLKEVEQQLESRKKAREAERDAKANAQARALEESRNFQGIRTVVPLHASSVRGILPSRHSRLGSRDADEEEEDASAPAVGGGVVQFSKDGGGVDQRAAPGVDDDAFESVEVQRSRLRVLAQRSGVCTFSKH